MTVTPLGKTKLTTEQIVDIITTYTTHKEAAEKHGVSEVSVRSIRAGRRHRKLYEIHSTRDLI